MGKKKDFRLITKEIKEACLSFGYGTIHFNKNIVELWIDDYENDLGVSILADAINIDFDVITLIEDNHSVVTFDQIHCINRQIQIYDCIYDYQDQLRYYELDWSDYFKAFRFSDRCIWRILKPDEARHIWFNGKGELYQLYDDETEGCIEEVERLNKCIENGLDIGIIASY